MSFYAVEAGAVVRLSDRRTVATLEAAGWTCTTWATDAEALVVALMVAEVPVGWSATRVVSALDLAHLHGMLTAAEADSMVEAHGLRQIRVVSTEAGAGSVLEDSTGERWTHPFAGALATAVRRAATDAGRCFAAAGGRGGWRADERVRRRAVQLATEAGADVDMLTGHIGGMRFADGSWLVFGPGGVVRVSEALPTAPDVDAGK